MIFVTVGTHEQPFNRLIKYMDEWAKDNSEKVIIQTGYSTYEPVHCVGEKMLPYNEMLDLVLKARIVITHGGPSSFIMPLQIGKIPIVVPRRKENNEHVNDHQVYFCRQVEERMGNIIVVEDIKDLAETIDMYNENIKKLTNGLMSNNQFFCTKLEKLVNTLLDK